MFINKSKIQFEIYSQQQWVIIPNKYKCLSINQRYNLKSIHNDNTEIDLTSESVYQ